MLFVIEGMQGSGKTAYCVSQILELLRDTKRAIVTNLPINPDKIVSHLAFNSVDIKALFERIFIFIDWDITSLKNFKKNNPVFYRSMGYTNLLPVKPGTSTEHPDTGIICFWKSCPKGSAIFIDEAYEHLSNNNFKDDKKNKNRDVLRSVVRQQRHAHYDLFFISQDIADLDIHIRRGVSMTYCVANSKYESVLNPKGKIGIFCKDFKWFIQFFKIRMYMGCRDDIKNSISGEYKDPDKMKTLKPPKYLFEMYDSHSVPSFFRGDEKTKFSIDSYDNIKPSFKRSLFTWVKACKWLFIIVFAGGVGGYILYSGYQSFYTSMVTPSNNKPVKKTVKTTKSKSKKEVKKQVEKEVKKVTPEVVYRSDNRIVYADNVVIKKNDVVKGFTVNEIKKNHVVLAGNGKLFKCSFSGLRK